MTLCQECLNRNTCKDICNALKKEITGRGKTASQKPKTYYVDFSFIEDPQNNINEFQKEVLHVIAGLSTATENSSIRKRDVDEAINAALSDNEKHFIRLFMDGYKQDEIAENLAISQPRVNFLFQRALRKLKKYFLSQL